MAPHRYRLVFGSKVTPDPMSSSMTIRGRFQTRLEWTTGLDISVLAFDFERVVDEGRDIILRTLGLASSD